MPWFREPVQDIRPEQDVTVIFFLRGYSYEGQWEKAGETNQPLLGWSGYR